MNIKLTDSEKKELLKAVTSGVLQTEKLKRVFDILVSENKIVMDNPFLPDEYILQE